jgi:hypothetical protein
MNDRVSFYRQSCYGRETHTHTHTHTHRERGRERGIEGREIERERERERGREAYFPRAAASSILPSADTLHCRAIDALLAAGSRSSKGARIVTEVRRGTAADVLPASHVRCQPKRP